MSSYKPGDLTRFLNPSADDLPSDVVSTWSNPMKPQVPLQLPQHKQKQEQQLAEQSQPPASSSSSVTEAAAVAALAADPVAQRKLRRKLEKKAKRRRARAAAKALKEGKPVPAVEEQPVDSSTTQVESVKKTKKTLPKPDKPDEPHATDDGDVAMDAGDQSGDESSDFDDDAEAAAAAGSAPTSGSAKAKRQKAQEREQRTVFVGNVKMHAKAKKVVKKLRKLFAPFGAVESVRLRSVAFTELHTPRMVQLQAKQFREGRDTCNAYVVFEKQDDAQKALSLNGTEVDGKHIRVDMASGDGRVKAAEHSVFVGNLPFDVTEEAVRTFFKDCGDITNVRLVRDRQTNIGKGFGFVSFATKRGMKAALAMHDTQFQKRTLRVFRTQDGKAAPNGKSFMGKTVDRRQLKKKAALRRLGKKGVVPDDARPSYMGRITKEVKTKKRKSPMDAEILAKWKVRSRTKDHKNPHKQAQQQKKRKKSHRQKRKDKKN